jgi:uncharacterized protein YcaQ
MAQDHLSQSEARRIALAAQGLDRPRAAGPVDGKRLAATIRQLGLVQIDCVNILVPAHYQVLFSRHGPFDRLHLDDLVYRSRQFTEQWAHEASIIPVTTWPLLRHRMECHRVRPYGFENFIAENPAYVTWVLEQVRARGPLTADTLPPPDGHTRLGPEHWFRSIPRAVLEAYFGQGVLAVANRLPNYARVYDLAENVLPADLLCRRVQLEEAQRQLLQQAARAHGVAAAGDLADYYRLSIGESRPRLAELVEAGVLRQVAVEGWREPGYLHRDAQLPRQVKGTALLSPFDPVIWSRQRVARLFNFDYRFEIFVPAAQRKWGSYVLPFLQGERLTARVDLNADRGMRRLLVVAAYGEPDADARTVVPALVAELKTLAAWLGLNRVAACCRGNLGRPLAAALRQSDPKL